MTDDDGAGGDDGTNGGRCSDATRPPPGSSEAAGARGGESGGESGDDSASEDAANGIVHGYESVSLPDGRDLAYATYGDPDGETVLFFHGNPGSRVSGALVADAAEWLDVRLIVPDRPGRGRSAPNPGHELLSWPEDVAALLDVLDVDAAGVVGFSAGGPFALACGYAIPDRVRGVAVVSGVGTPEMVERLGTRSEYLFAALARAPWLARGPYKAAAVFARNDPDRLLEFMKANFSAADRPVFENDRTGSIVVADVREAFRRGTRWPAFETGLLAREWGFDPASVAPPVTVWHGRDDLAVPPAIARELAAALPDARCELLDAEGHYSTLVDHPRPVLYSALDEQ